MPFTKFPAVDETNKFPAVIRQAMALYTELTSAFAAKSTETAFNTHAANVANPHAVTKAQVGLGNVDNTSDANKPVSALQKDIFISQGTSAQRDAQYGVPSTTADKVILANKKVVWYNTTTLMFETYYATTGSTGLAVTGIVGASGWYPELSTVYKKITLATPANHTAADPIVLVRTGAIVTMQGRTTRNAGGTAFLPAGAIPVGFRPVAASIFPQWALAGVGVLGQVSSDGSSATPFSTGTGDFMATATWATDPAIPPF
jgi:hypothetical protein